MILDRGGRGNGKKKYSFFFEAGSVHQPARGSEMHPDAHYIVIRLSSIMKPEYIAIHTGISKSSVPHTSTKEGTHRRNRQKKREKK